MAKATHHVHHGQMIADEKSSVSAMLLVHGVIDKDGRLHIVVAKRPIDALCGDEGHGVAEINAERAVVVSHRSCEGTTVIATGQRKVLEHILQRKSKQENLCSRLDETSGTVLAELHTYTDVDFILHLAAVLLSALPLVKNTHGCLLSKCFELRSLVVGLWSLPAASAVHRNACRCHEPAALSSCRRLCRSGESVPSGCAHGFATLREEGGSGRPLDSYEHSPSEEKEKEREML